MTSIYTKIFNEIKNDPQNLAYTKQGIDPLYYVNEHAKLVIVGQAPGRVAQERMRVWDDKSGDRLRNWLEVDRETFYHSGKIAVLPMDFYFPGKGKSGDLPPRKGFAEKWHSRLFAAMPEVKLTILVGSYAIKHYLQLKSSAKLTDVVHNYQEYLPEYFPLVHPSPRNQLWMKRNPWFEPEVLPDLKHRVSQLMNEN